MRMMAPAVLPLTIVSLLTVHTQVPLAAQNAALTALNSAPRAQTGRSGELLSRPAEPVAPTGVGAVQTRIVTGKVTDSLSGETVTSGQVSVAGSTSATTIKEDGTFTLAVPMREVTLSVRSIGFKRKDLALAANTNSIQVSLARDYFQLEAIVVTGQATGVERKNLANAVASVDAQQLVRASASQSSGSL